VLSQSGVWGRFWGHFNDPRSDLLDLQRHCSSCNSSPVALPAAAPYSRRPYSCRSISTRAIVEGIGTGLISTAGGGAEAHYEQTVVAVDGRPGPPGHTAARRHTHPISRQSEQSAELPLTAAAARRQGLRKQAGRPGQSDHASTPPPGEHDPLAPHDDFSAAQRVVGSRGKPPAWERTRDTTPTARDLRTLSQGGNMLWVALSRRV
jgi:hypothetical protein